VHLKSKLAAGLQPRESGWTWLLTAGAALTVPYVALHGTVFNSGPVFNIFGGASVVAILVASRLRKVARLPWLLIGLGQAMFVAGDVIAYNYREFFGTSLPFPGLDDAFYLATYPLLIAGLVLQIRQRTPTHDRASLIDTLIVWTASGALTWALLIAPYFHDPTLSTPTKLTSIAYPVMDLGILACVIRFAFGSGLRGTPFYLLILGSVSLFLTDSIYGWLLLHGGYATGGVLDVGWIAFYLLAAAAALHPNVPQLVEPVRDAQFRLTHKRIAALTVASLATPTVLIIQTISGNTSDVSLLAACSIVAFVLVILRLLDLVKRHDTALHRATVLADGGVDLIQARTQSETIEAAIGIAKRILGSERDIVFVPSGQDLNHDDLVLRLQGRTASLGALVARAAGDLDADTTAAMQMLANEVAMALDGVIMAEHLLKRRTEARFQSLVQNASDVIILVDSEGRITFASPSVRRIFGYEPAQLEGESFISIVLASHRPKIVHAILSDRPRSAALALEFEIETSRGPVEVEATCTNLLHDKNVGGIVLTMRDISERKSFERQLAHQAFHDEVTGLANRVLFHDRVEHALARTRRDNSTLAIIFLDLDDFKMVNDTLGHGAGDALLRSIGARITHEVRAVDTAARLGGDEFAILIEGGDRATSAELAQRLLHTIAAPMELEGRQISVTASAGVAEGSRASEVSAVTLLRQADVAMYAAKESGRGRHKIFEPEMHTAALERLEMKRALQLALENDEFELHYQPIVDLKTEVVFFIEALLRWHHDGHNIGPMQFIPLAEETGLIVPIGAWVLEHAVAEAMRLRRLAGNDAPPISVNVSARQLQRPELVDEVGEVLRRTGLPPDRLILEITETSLMNDLDLAVIRLQQLKSLGIRLAIDDFGTGYSSLNYIRKFPVDILKVDRSFIRDLGKPGEVANLTRTIMELGSILNMVPVAEGIEHDDQLEELRRLGCPLGQGFLFMKPVDARGIEAAILNKPTRLGAPEEAA
jgi:diguanylate cyclase (GGDEF)-like protein/PAS domain S-box-containing protein